MVLSEQQFYDSVVVALMGNEKVYDRKQYRSKSDADVAKDIHEMAMVAVENRRNA